MFMHLIIIHRRLMQALHNAKNAACAFFLEYKTLPQDDPITYSLLPALIILKIQLFPRSVPLHLDPRGFSAIIRNRLLEPLMLERLLGGETLLRIVDEDAAEKVEELLVERCGRGNDLLQPFQLLHG